MPFLLFWSLAFCVAGIGKGSLASWDEAYYALVSREIFRTGDWINLRYFDTPFYDKPPLYLWSTSFFYHLFGVSEFSTRLTSALAGVGVILVTYFLGKRLVGPLAALAGAGILLSSSDFLHYARWGTLDVTHLFFFTLALLFYFKAREEEKHWLGFWVASALAVMTKGPLIGLAWLLILSDSLIRKEFSFLKRPFFWGGAALAVLLVLPWHLAAYHAHPDLFLKDFLYKNYIARTGGAVEGHTGNWYFYIRTLVNKYHPWVLLAPAALVWAAWGRDRFRAHRFLLLWIAVVFVFFTFAVQTKLQWYILLLHPALSLVLGSFVASVIFKDRHPQWLKAGLILALLLQVRFSGAIVQDYSPALKEMAPAVKQRVPAGRPVLLYDYHEQPTATFYFDRPVRYADSPGELEDAVRTDVNALLLVPEKKYPALAEMFVQKGFHEKKRSTGFKTDLVLLAKG